MVGLIATGAEDDGNSDERLKKVIADYIRASEAGAPPDRQQILEEHWELVSQLQPFFEQWDREHELADPSRGFARDEFDRLEPGLRVKYLGNYELLEEVARAAMGIVYKARQLNLDRIVAVKTTFGGRVSHPDDLKRFHIEAKAVANLQHPNIVAIHEFGVHEGLPYVAMDFVEGPRLSEILRQNSLSTRQAAIYVRQIAEAIEYVHRQGTLHRDLKPSNILIDSRDQVRITGFDLATSIDGNSDPTRAGEIVGTPSYMAPEQAQGISLIGPGSDVYSLGTILYECVTGRVPFRTNSVIETIELVIRGDVPAPRQLNPRIDRDFEAICLKCLRKEPLQRYATAQLLADDLQHFLEGRSILARPFGLLEKTWRWCRRMPFAAAMIATVALLAGGIKIGSTVGMLVNSQQKRELESSRLAASVQQAAVVRQEKILDEERDH